MTIHIETQQPDHLYLHWSGDDSYRQVFSAYHCNIQALWPLPLARVVHTNAYDTLLHRHTANRNTNGVAISCCGGTSRYPITKYQVEAMCLEGARVCVRFNIPVDKEHVATHCEVAIIDGYYPERIDFEGRGDELRTKLRWYYGRLKDGRIK